MAAPHKVLEVDQNRGDAAATQRLTQRACGQFGFQAAAYL